MIVASDLLVSEKRYFPAALILVIGAQCVDAV
jgi:hypothetical protein